MNPRPSRAIPTVIADRIRAFLWVRREETKPEPNCATANPTDSDKKERTGLSMGDVKLLLYERHQRRKDEASHEIQKKKTGKEENRSGSGPKGFWNGA